MVFRNTHDPLNAPTGFFVVVASDSSVRLVWKDLRASCAMLGFVRVAAGRTVAKERTADGSLAAMVAVFA